MLLLQSDSCRHCYWCGKRCYDGEPQCLWHGIHQEECPEYSWEHRWLARAFVERYITLCGEPPTEREFMAAGVLAKSWPHSPATLADKVLSVQWKSQ